jgi:hypothetical protein
MTLRLRWACPMTLSRPRSSSFEVVSGLPIWYELKQPMDGYDFTSVEEELGLMRMRRTMQATAIGASLAA